MNIVQLYGDHMRAGKSLDDFIEAYAHASTRAEVYGSLDAKTLESCKEDYRNVARKFLGLQNSKELDAAKLILRYAENNVPPELLLKDPWLASEQQMWARTKAIHKSIKENQEVWAAGQVLLEYFKKEGLIKVLD